MAPSFPRPPRALEVGSLPPDEPPRRLRWQWPHFGVFEITRVARPLCYGCSTAGDLPTTPAGWGNSAGDVLLIAKRLLLRPARLPAARPRYIQEKNDVQEVAVQRTDRPPACRGIPHDKRNSRRYGSGVDNERAFRNPEPPATCLTSSRAADRGTIGASRWADRIAERGTTGVGTRRSAAPWNDWCRPSGGGSSCVMIGGVQLCVGGTGSNCHWYNGVKYCNNGPSAGSCVTVNGLRYCSYKHAGDCIRVNSRTYCRYWRASVRSGPQAGELLCKPQGSPGVCPAALDRVTYCAAAVAVGFSRSIFTL